MIDRGSRAADRMPATRVLVIDDSVSARRILSHLIERDTSLEVVGTAEDGLAAWEKVKELAPDVLTLDVEMPRMDGLRFLEKLMKEAPVRTVMVSSHTERGRETTLRALEMGAIDYIPKPTTLDEHTGLQDFARELSAKIRTAATARLRLPSRPRQSDPLVPVGSAAHAANKMVVIGASTGGAEALRDVLRCLPAGSPPVVVVQHMPEGFTRTFAERLDKICQVRVREARNGDVAAPGNVLIAPGNQHVRLKRVGTRFLVEVYDATPVKGFRPSVDVLFHSCTREAKANGVGVLMTGMGDDGAKGLKALREAGGRTIVQDESTCVVFGMPREAIEIGAAQHVVPLGRIADAVLRLH